MKSSTASILIASLLAVCLGLATMAPCVQAGAKEDKIASIGSMIEATKKDIKENQRLYDYYKYRNLMAAKARMGMSPGPGTHLGPYGETVEPIQPGNADDEFSSSQDMMNHHQDMINVCTQQLTKLEADLAQAQKEPVVSGGGGGSGGSGSEGGY